MLQQNLEVMPCLILAKKKENKKCFGDGKKFLTCAYGRSDLYRCEHFHFRSSEENQAETVCSQAYFKYFSPKFLKLARISAGQYANFARTTQEIPGKAIRSYQILILEH